MKDFSMYRYFRGETENPFEQLQKDECNLSENEAKRLQNCKMFWFYESVFETIFNRETNSYWRNNFNVYVQETCKRILHGTDKEKPTESNKATVFDIWLNDYLFVDKLDIEYGGDNWYKKEYYKNSL